MPDIKTLIVASECAPFVKTGGLADVVGALPAALAAEGIDARVLIPRYPALAKLAEHRTNTHALGDLYGAPAELWVTEVGGMALYLLDAPHLYDRDGGIYLDGSGKDWPDNAERFAALSEIGARIAAHRLKDWQPDILHAHDWQAGLAPWYLRQWGHEIPTIFTIHNIAFQGLFDADQADALGLDQAGFTPDGYEYYGQISFMKAAINTSDRITTVSPTYARELMLPDFGMGFDGLLRSKRADLSGILNGIDLGTWDPETDPSIPTTYTVRSLSRKKQNKTAVETRFGLVSNEDAPLFCVISRLTSQKGLDLLLVVLPVLTNRGGRLALVGSGDAALETAFRQAASDYPGQVGVVIGYDEALSHLMQAGSDCILVPSRFEPCGLTQLYGLRYGTLPLVARTGGLADTVIDANDAALKAGCATGFQFAPITAAALAEAINRACDLFQSPKAWASVMRNAMRHPVGWDASAKAYRTLFETLLATSAQETGD